MNHFGRLKWADFPEVNQWLSEKSTNKGEKTRSFNYCSMEFLCGSW